METARGQGHVLLLGDSVFDNAAYVAAGPDVVTQLRQSLPIGWQATLAAVDGAVTADARRQLARAPAGVTHLVVSAGGNDALRAEAILTRPVRSVAEGLELLAQARERFVQEYRSMLDAAVVHGLPIVVCTIYDPRFGDRLRQRLALAGLALFNDVIIREAFARRLPLLDLRLVCSEDADFANPIEPSVQGGRKIAAAVADMVLKRAAR
jgi:lysophospholipase L1-like esterase